MTGNAVANAVGGGFATVVLGVGTEVAEVAEVVEVGAGVLGVCVVAVVEVVGTLT